MSKAQTASELVESSARKLLPVEQALRSHRYLAAVEAGRVPRERLREFAGEQFSILQSDRRSFEHLARRYPEPPAGEFFTGMAQGEKRAFDHLLVLGEALGIDKDWLRLYEPHPICQAYPSYVASLALGGSRADVVLAFLVNLAAWRESCARMGSALRDAYGFDSDAVEFFDFFATPPADFADRALEVVDSGLAEGESEIEARRAARLLQAYELIYWDALAENAGV